MEPNKTLRSNRNEAKVSVIIPFFNSEDYLADSINSILAQTYTNWELILVNDGSNDGSAEIAESFSAEYPEKIFLVSHDGNENRGASSSRNRGIGHATGDFITFLDSDDVFFKETLESEIRVFQANPEIDAVCGTIQYWFSWNEEANKKERDFAVNLGVQTEKIYEPPKLLVHNLRASGRKPGMGCVILRSDFVRKYELFVDDFTYVSEDQLFWTNVSLRARIYVMDKILAKYRQHNLSSSALLAESGKTSDDWNKFLDWLEKLLRENKVDDQHVWNGLRSCQRENAYRKKYAWILNLYQRVFPHFIRYRIRDLIIWFRFGKN